MFNFLTSNSDSIILKSFSVKPDDDTILNIQGERIGLFKWILSKLGLSDPSYSLVIAKDYCCIISGKTESYLPFKELHDFVGGYTQSKISLLLAITGVVFTFFGFLGNLFSGAFLASIGGLVFGGLISAFFYWLYKNSGKMFLNFNTHNNTNINLYMQSGKITLQGGETVTYEQVQKVLSEIIKHAKDKSKYFN